MVRWSLLCTKMESGAISGIALIEGFVGQESFDFSVMWPGLVSTALGSSNITFEARNQVRCQPFSGLFREQGITCMQTSSTDVELNKSPWPLKDEQNFCPRTILKWDKGKQMCDGMVFARNAFPFPQNPLENGGNPEWFPSLKFFNPLKPIWPVSFLTFAIKSFSSWKFKLQNWRFFVSNVSKSFDCWCSGRCGMVVGAGYSHWTGVVCADGHLLFPVKGLRWHRGVKYDYYLLEIDYVRQQPSSSMKLLPVDAFHSRNYFETKIIIFSPYYTRIQGIVVMMLHSMHRGVLLSHRLSFPYVSVHGPIKCTVRDDVFIARFLPWKILMNFVIKHTGNRWEGTTFGTWEKNMENSQKNYFVRQLARNAWTLTVLGRAKMRKSRKNVNGNFRNFFF